MRLSTDDVRSLADALRAVAPRVQVLWSLPAAQQPALAAAWPPRTVVCEFVDQRAVLASPSTAAFLSHGGANSVSEAAMYGVPLLLAPMGADQPMNARHAVDPASASRSARRRG